MGFRSAYPLDGRPGEVTGFMERIVDPDGRAGEGHIDIPDVCVFAHDYFLVKA